MAIFLSEAAAAHIKALCEAEGASMVRLSVEGGGCSGFQYVFGFANTPDSDDTVYEEQGAKLVVDAASLPLLAGSTLDYVNNLGGAHFKVLNPNASGGCGCGVSFAL